MVDIPANTTTTAELEGFSSFRSFSGEFEVAGDRDWVKVDLTGGRSYHLFLSSLDAGSASSGNAIIRLRDANGLELATNDDGGVGQNAHLFVSVVTSGTFYIDVGVSGDNAAGSYSLVVARDDGETNAFHTDANDNVTAGQGARVVGGKGADTISLGAEGLEALGEQGNDIITGNAENNFISGGLGNDTITGGGGNDLLLGDAGDDIISGGDNNDTIYGGAGNDILNGDAGGDVLFAGAGNDFVYGGANSDNLYAGPGIDVLDGGTGDDFLLVAGSNGIGDTFQGGAGFDELTYAGSVGPAILSGFNATSSSIESLSGNGSGLLGTAGANVFDFSGLTFAGGGSVPFVDGRAGNDRITGSSDDDDLRGGAGKDILNGGAGNDVLTGGAHRDVLTGGAGADLFDFNSIGDTRKGPANRDIITDFQRGLDDIDLRTIDAKTGVKGNQKFKFIGKQDFHGKKGELHYEKKGGNVLVEGDVNGDGKADFQIFLKGVGALSAGDFFL